MRSHMPVERTVYFYASLSIYSSEMLVNYSLSSMNCQSFPIGVAWPPLWQRLSPSSELQGVAEVKHGDSLLSTGHRVSSPECELDRGKGSCATSKSKRASVRLTSRDLLLEDSDLVNYIIPVCSQEALEYEYLFIINV